MTAAYLQQTTEQGARVLEELDWSDEAQEDAALIELIGGTNSQTAAEWARRELKRRENQ